MDGEAGVCTSKPAASSRSATIIWGLSGGRLMSSTSELGLLGCLGGGWRRIKPVALEHCGGFRRFEIFEQLY